MKFLLSSCYQIEDYYDETAAVAIFDSEEDAHAVGKDLYPDGKYEVMEIVENIRQLRTVLDKQSVIWSDVTQPANYTIKDHQVITYGNLSSGNTYPDYYTPASFYISRSLSQGDIVIIAPKLHGSPEFVAEHLDEAIKSFAEIENDPRIIRHRKLQANGGVENFLPISMSPDTGLVYIKSKLVSNNPQGPHLYFKMGVEYRIFDGKDFGTLRLVKINRGARLSKANNPIKTYEFWFSINHSEPRKNAPNNILLFVDPAQMTTKLD